MHRVGGKQVSCQNRERTSLVVHWLRVRLPMQGTWVRFLPREDLTCHEHCPHRKGQPASPPVNSPLALSWEFWVALQTIQGAALGHPPSTLLTHLQGLLARQDWTQTHQFWENQRLLKNWHNLRDPVIHVITRSQALPEPSCVSSNVSHHPCDPLLFHLHNSPHSHSPDFMRLFEELNEIINMKPRRTSGSGFKKMLANVVFTHLLVVS